MIAPKDFRLMTKREKGTFLKRHRGFLTRCAESSGFSLGQVSRVFWGHSKGRDQIIDCINAAVNAATIPQQQ